MTDNIGKRIRDSFSRQTLMKTLGANVESVGSGLVIVAAPIGDHVLQQHGFAHAGMTFALGDSAAGYSALTLLPDGAEVNTIEMKINLLRPASGERIIATGRVIRPGKRVFAVEAVVEVETGDQRSEVARLMGTMIPL